MRLFHFLISDMTKGFSRSDGSCTPHLSLCSQALSWSGSHRVNAGEELFYTQSRLAVAGRPQLCSLTITLSNSSTARSSNVSLFSEVNGLGIPSIEVHEQQRHECVLLSAL